MFRWGVVAYLLLSVVALLLGEFWLERSPWTHPAPWLELGTALPELYSLLLGLTFATSVVVASRITVQRFEWARRLHADFHPFARHLTSGGIVLLAGASALGEELLFRGVLQPAVGLVPQALIFGLVHQLPGQSRWVWVSWAAFVGLFLGALFQLTGSLVGPICAHALINGLNLNHLRDHSPLPMTSRLGGLLDRPNT